MGVAYGVSDLYPQVCVRYSCPCGRQAVRHGRMAGEAPDGWVVAADDRGDARCLCEDCAAVEAAPPASRSST